jgi:hypothetical protein
MYVTGDDDNICKTQVVANANMELGDVLLKIQARDVHRVWLTSGDNKVLWDDAAIHDVATLMRL